VSEIINNTLILKNDIKKTDKKVMSAASLLDTIKSLAVKRNTEKKFVLIMFENTRTSVLSYLTARTAGQVLHPSRIQHAGNIFFKY